jgi:NTE family protein
MLLVDGGVLDPVPVGLARLLAPGLPIIAVALSPAAEDWEDIPLTDVLASAPLPISLPAQIIQGFSRMRIGQAMRIFSQSMEISSMMMAELRLRIDKPDLILRPRVYDNGMFDLTDPLKLVEAGRQAVDRELASLQRETSWRGQIDRLFRSIRPVDGPKVLRQLTPIDELEKPPKI